MNHPLPLKEQLKALEHLQELDLKIDSLKKNKNAIPIELKNLEDGVNKTRLIVEAKINAISEVDKVKRQTEAALDLNKDRLNRANTKLEAVHNSQEFQAANKEIDQLKKANLALEDQLKKTKQELDGVNQELSLLNDELKNKQESFDARAATLSTEESKLTAQVAELLQERLKYTSLVEARILSQYDRVRMARAGLAVVPAVGGRCKGCNMMVPPQLYNELQRGTQLHSCPSCHRILLIPQQSSEVSATNPQTS